MTRRVDAAPTSWPMAVPLLLVVVASLAGCAGTAAGDEAAGSAASSAAPSVDPLDTLQLTAPTARPELPPQALEPTQDGAIAFVTYWFNTLNYALENNDDTALESDTAGSCPQCNAWVLVAVKNKNAGATMVGGLTAPVRLAIGPFSTVEPLPFRATFVSTEALVTQPDGTAAAYPRLVGDGLVTVQWSADASRWLMADVQLPPPAS